MDFTRKLLKSVSLSIRFCIHFLVNIIHWQVCYGTFFSLTFVKKLLRILPCYR